MTSAIAINRLLVGGRIKEILRSVVAVIVPLGLTVLTAAPAAVSASEARTPPWTLPPLFT